MVKVSANIANRVVKTEAEVDALVGTLKSRLIAKVKEGYTVRIT